MLNACAISELYGSLGSLLVSLKPILVAALERCLIMFQALEENALDERCSGGHSDVAGAVPSHIVKASGAKVTVIIVQCWFEK
jgi:hypothetical protein